MSRAHINSYLRLKDILIPTDNSTIGLWHFDRHMYNTCGIPPSENTGTLMPGKFGGGALVQEAVTNLWSGGIGIYNNYSVPASLTATGETYRGQPVLRLAMTVDDAHSASLSNFQTSLSSHGVLGSYRTYLAYVKYSASIYWRPVNKIDINFGGTASNISGWTAMPHEDMGNGWFRYAQVRNGLVSTDKSDNIFFSFACPSMQLNETVYIDLCCPQIEEGRDFPTPYVSSSVPNQKITYADMLPPKTVFCHFRLLTGETRPTLGDDRILLWFANVDANGTFYDNASYWKVYIPGGSTDIRLECTNAQEALGQKSLIVSEVDVLDKAWHCMSIRFNGLDMEFSVDNIYKKVSWTTAPIFNSQRLGIGNDPEGFTRSANVCIDELRCDSIYVPDKEVTAWAMSGRPFYDPYDYSLSESSSLEYF